MAESKLERAKRQTIKKWETLANMLFEDSSYDYDSFSFKKIGTCGFCNEFAYMECCKYCPIYTIEEVECFLSVRFKRINSFTDCLAVVLYIHQF